MHYASETAENRVLLEKARKASFAGEWLRGTQLYQEAAERGSPYGMAMLGIRLAGSSKDNHEEADKAIKWLERAIDAGDRQLAPLNLGAALLRGRVVTRDVPRGLQLLAMSAREGAYIATSLLARTYAVGKFGVERDMRLASLWAATKAPPSIKVSIYAAHYTGLHWIRDGVARRVILKMSRKAREMRRRPMAQTARAQRDFSQQIRDHR